MISSYSRWMNRMEWRFRDIFGTKFNYRHLVAVYSTAMEAIQKQKLLERQIMGNHSVVIETNLNDGNQLPRQHTPGVPHSLQRLKHIFLRHNGPNDVLSNYQNVNEQNEQTNDFTIYKYGTTGALS